MDNEGYISCGSCHFEGLDDGRVYDFSNRGEGLRNTVTLLGRGGTKQGRLNWTGTLDEVQDFEHQVRDLFKGRGFLPDEVFHSGTVDQPLGAPKAGLSPELDALAAYVSSLDHVNPSPFRNADGSLTTDALAGKKTFQRLGCGTCHAGLDATDSSRNLLHDVGTITPLSGQRAGQPLLGFDTPTLLGVWETPPYLHDGSAPTLRDVLVTKNHDDLHGYVSSLSPAELDELVAYLQQLDGDISVRQLPFESAPRASDPAAGNESGMRCTVSGHPEKLDGSALSVLGLCVLTTWLRRRAGGFARAPRRRLATSSRLLSVLALLTLAGVTGCMKDDASAAEASRAPTDWSQLPAVVTPDAELASLGSRQQTLDRVCARKRGDAVAKALCGPAGRPEIRDFAELLEVVGLDQQRAFALTGNSTSLLARNVSAINPRILVFPRVDDELHRPAEMVAVGFVRGEQIVELVSRDSVTDDFNFYLLSFEQRCSYQAGGCDLASRLSEEIEHDWSAYSIYDQDDLEGTSVDCNSCHQPGGFGTKRMLRMQELASPWLHWFPQRFGQRTESDRVLLEQFATTHAGDQQYGGIPIPVITNAVDEGSGAQLEALVRAEGSQEQPNPFDPQIAAEMKAGNSPLWEARFAAHLEGKAIAVPYPAIDVTDVSKRQAAAQSYASVVAGTAARESLLDIRDVFSNDAMTKLSFTPQPGASGSTVLLQMCARCHDGRGNPSLGKNRFNVLQLSTLSREEKELAIARLSDTGGARMPPWRVGSLTPESIQAATAELQK
jgi:mono/diheme cytochrome c family protein